MPNPYLQQSANDIATNLTQNWQQNALPSINSGAMLAGGFGGSRQGVAQALSANGLNQAIGQAQTGLYSNAYNTDQQLQAQRDMQAAQLGSSERIAGMQDATQRYGMGNQYNLGLGQLGLGARAADTSQYNAETSRGLGYGQMQMQGDQNAFNNQYNAAQLQLAGLGAQQNWLNQGVNMANQQQQLPLQNLGLLSNIGAQIGGQGGSMTQPGASTIGSAMGGALTLAQLYKILGGN